LGKRINEKVSLLRKIETGKMTPDNRLATMLEHALKIKLIVPAKEEKVPQAKLARASGRELTLGDLIQLDKNGSGKEDTAGRRQS
jgi:putative transcription factor